MGTEVEVKVKNLPHHAVFHIEETIVTRGGSKNLVEMFTVGVRDEYLAEVVPRHIFYNTRHATGIQLVENVVKQQDGSAYGPY